jgi:hypothetical protein
MDGGSGIGYVQLAPGGGEEGMGASGRLDSRGGGETVKKGGGVLNGLPVGAERRKGKMGLA